MGATAVVGDTVTGKGSRTEGCGGRQKGGSVGKSASGDPEMGRGVGRGVWRVWSSKGNQGFLLAV